MRFDFNETVGELTAYQVGRLKEHFNRDELMMNDGERQLWKNRLENYEPIISNKTENEATRVKCNEDTEELKAGEMVASRSSK